MKKNIIFSALLSLFLVIGYSQAQNQGPQMDQKLTAEQKAQKVSDRLEKALKLTPEQKISVQELTLTKIKKTREVRTTDAKDKKSRGEAFKSIRRDYDAGMKEILNPEQEAQWDKLKAEAKARREAKKSESGQKVSPTDDLEKDLDLELE